MRRLLKQGAAMCLAALTSVGAYATPIIIHNQSPFMMEVSGSVSVTSNQALINPAGAATLEMKKNSITHLMLMSSDDSGYQDNVLVRRIDGKLSAVSLYGKEKITLEGDQVVVAK